MSTLTLAGRTPLRLATDNGQAMPARTEGDVRALISRHAGTTPLGLAITELCIPIALQLGLNSSDTASMVRFARFLSTKTGVRSVAA